MDDVVWVGEATETRADLIVMRLAGVCVEQEFPVRPHDARPGDLVAIYRGGEVEVLRRATGLPPGVTERTLPSEPPRQE